MSSSEIQDSAKMGRKSLKTLQHTASDRENLVGRPSKTLKHQLTTDSPPMCEVEVKRKNLLSKETQANFDKQITVDDLTNPDGPSEHYWEVLAEKRQAALQEVLEENETLRKIIEDLKEENSQYKQMLDEANSFVEVIKEELANSSNNDTGIDVNDVSHDVTQDAEESDSENTQINQNKAD